VFLVVHYGVDQTKVPSLAGSDSLGQLAVSGEGVDKVFHNCCSV